MYLHHVSERGEFFLASDAVVPSFTRDVRLVDIVNQIPPAEVNELNRIGYTIGGMMLFPATASVGDDDQRCTWISPEDKRPVRPDG